MKQTIRKTITVLLALVMVLTLLPTVTVTARANDPISLGNETIPTLSDSETPLTLQAKTGGTIVVNYPKEGMQYSLNGATKTDVTTTAINVSAEDKVAFYGNANSYEGTTISGGTAQCYIYGNIMSLINATDFASATALTEGAAFQRLFNENTCLLSHPSRKLVLPATTLTESCYAYMFANCTGLTTAPELPATTLAGGCYDSMFYYCTSLTTAPALPATTLAVGCYYNMFLGCTGLTTAPELRATTLAVACYANMFAGCSNLNAVTCLATDISATFAIGNWLEGVADTGTFTKAPDTDWPTGSSGIPEKWTVEENSTTPVSYSTYTLTIPAAVTVSGAGWNATGGVGASGELAKGKKLTVTAASGDDFALVCEGKGQIGYYLAATATDTQPTTTWTFTALDDDPATQPMGVIVSETDYNSARPGTYTDTVTFTAQVEEAAALQKLTVPAYVWSDEVQEAVKVDVDFYYMPNETWKQAIENHPENAGWSTFDNSFDVFISKGEKYTDATRGINDFYIIDENADMVDFDLPVDPTITIRLVDPAI